MCGDDREVLLRWVNSYLIAIETQLSPGDRLNFSTLVRGLNFFRVFSAKIILSPDGKHGKIKSVPSLLIKLSFSGNQE